jgi:hypothetical protein
MAVKRGADMLGSIRNWTMSAVVVAGWVAAAALAFLCYVLPLAPLLFVIAIYVLWGMVLLLRTGAPALLEVNLVQLLGLCVAWPLALHSGMFKK